ncbi:unnamed protein product, partial [marine sediment metagenome]
LQRNYLASQSDLYVFIDAPKTIIDEPKVRQVQQLVQEIIGFNSVKYSFADSNIGCADSIIGGVSKVLNQHPSAIIVEDDIVTAPNFLDYMNQCLARYASEPGVFSIAGYTFPFRRPADYPADTYFMPRHSPWGWATWADRWHSVDWSIADYDQFITDREQQKAFMQGGTDLVRMLRRQMEGEIDAWDIRFCYNRYKANALTVYPTTSKVQNIGFGKEATHTNVYNQLIANNTSLILSLCFSLCNPLQFWFHNVQ